MRNVCKHGNYVLGSRKYGENIDELSDCYLFYKDCVPASACFRLVSSVVRLILKFFPKASVVS